MAGDWIKMRVDLLKAPEVKGIARRTGLNRFDVIGRLHAVWSWADQQLRDGNAVGVTAEDIDEEAQHPGFSQAMSEERWLKISSTGISFPNFDRHNGKPAKDRALTSKRVKRHRDGDSVASQLPDRYASVTREEKSINNHHPVVKGTARAQEPPAEPPEGKSKSSPRTRSRSEASTQQQIAAQRAVKPSGMPPSVAAQIPRAPPKDAWWITPAGVAKQARVLDMSRGPGEEPVTFRCRVFARMGDGPWMEGLNAIERSLVDRLSPKAPPELTREPPAAKAG